MNGIRNSLKDAMKWMLLRFKYDSYILSKTNGFLVLCYHSIPHSGHWFYDVPRIEFEQHILYLKKNFRLVKAEDLLTLTPSSDKNSIPLAITFDDGYVDNYTNAVPVLREHNVPATFFISSGIIDASINRKIEPSEHVVKRMMTWSQIQEISDDHLFDVGSHGHKHLSMTSLSPEEIARELTESKQNIQKYTGKEPVLFSYPGGFHNSGTKSHIEKLGFAGGLTSDQTVNRYNNDRYAIGRIAITLKHRKIPNLAYVLTHFAKRSLE